MTPQALDRPVITGAALRSANFFNGRLLTGEDLRSEQAASHARLQRLGRAGGEGVAHGLEVRETAGTSTKSRPVVTVAAGLAVSRSGQIVELGADVDLALARERATEGSEPDGLFADCQPFAPGTYSAGAGVYLLTVGPAQHGEGRAPVSGLSNQPAPCNVAVSVEAVRFHLIRLALPPAELADKPLLRNRTAYLCFAHGAVAGWLRDPFGPTATAAGTLIDVLRGQTLTRDEVPLAIFGWSVDDGIQFVDLWSVRRRLARPAAEGAGPLARDRRHADSEAMLLQFRDHLADLRVTEPPQASVAGAHFEFLPPAGLLPIGMQPLPAFDSATFFSDVPVREGDPAVLEAARVVELLDDAASYPPIELAREELVWLYLVRENVEPSAGAPQPQRYVVFANGQIPYRADGRYELSRWNFANYAEVD